MQAILLAGGLGTRLRSVVSDRPKPMALIGEKPFMEYVVHELSRHGITDIIFAVGYKGSMVEEYFGDGSGFTAPDRDSHHGSLRLRGRTSRYSRSHQKCRQICYGGQFFVQELRIRFYQIDYSRLVTMSMQSDLDMALVLRKVPVFPGTGQPC